VGEPVLKKFESHHWSTNTAKHSNWLQNMISIFYNLRLAGINFASHQLLCKSSCNSHICSSYEPVIVRHMITDCHIFGLRNKVLVMIYQSLWSLVSRQWS